jgi:hypothetical protein
MRVLVKSRLPCDADHAWAEVQTSALLREICWPLIRLAPAGGASDIAERWVSGATVQLRLFLCGFIPLGTRHLHWERIDQRQLEMQTREHDPLIRRWDHRIHVEPMGASQCRYTDDVEIEAGLLTLPVWLFAQWFYRHRQHRWKAVARRIQSALV